MSLEAAAGKNPVSHVGKIYNVLAPRLATALVDQIPAVAAAQCLIVSQIGAPVTEPALLQIKLATPDGVPPAHAAKEAEVLANAELAAIPSLVDELIAGAIEIH